MAKIFAGITGVNGYVPENILTNFDLEKMVETSDEWLTTRTGIKTRHILNEKDKASAFMGGEAVKGLLEKKGISPDEIELLICATVTPDMQFPATANLISEAAGIKNAFSFDINAACSGFLFTLATAARYVESGRYKKVIVVGAEKMSSIVDYTDRNTCALFGDAASAVLLEPVEEGFGIIDEMFGTDGSGAKHLHLKAGGSLKPSSQETIDAREHFIYQEGQTVFKFAVSKMADVSVDMMNKHEIAPDDLNWLVPHQANMRIIEATARRMGIRKEQVMINISKYGNTTSATIPLCLWEWEDQLRKGDQLILAAFGGGFTWGSLYIKWAYDGK